MDWVGPLAAALGGVVSDYGLALAAIIPVTFGVLVIVMMLRKINGLLR